MKRAIGTNILIRFLKNRIVTHLLLMKILLLFTRNLSKMSTHLDKKYFLLFGTVKCSQNKRCENITQILSSIPKIK